MCARNIFECFVFEGVATREKPCKIFIGKYSQMREIYNLFQRQSFNYDVKHERREWEDRGQQRWKR